MNIDSTSIQSLQMETVTHFLHFQMSLHLYLGSPLIKGESNWRHKLAWKLKTANNFTWLLHLGVLSICTWKKSRFCFEFEPRWEQPCWFALHLWRVEKCWLMTDLILLPRLPALFMTSPIQTAGHEMAVLMEANRMISWRPRRFSHSFVGRIWVAVCCSLRFFSVLLNVMLSLLFLLQEFRKRLTVMTKEAYYYLSKTESLKAIASQFHILLLSWRLKRQLPTNLLFHLFVS